MKDKRIVTIPNLLSLIRLLLIPLFGRVNGAAFHGKVATVFLDGLMLAHLLWGNMPAAVSVALVTLTTLFMLLSLWLYAMTNIAKLKRLQTRKTITALECEQKKEANVASGSQ